MRFVQESNPDQLFATIGASHYNIRWVMNCFQVSFRVFQENRHGFDGRKLDLNAFRCI